MPMLAVLVSSELDVDKIEYTLQAGLVAEKIRIALAQPYRLTIKLEGKADKTIEHPCDAHGHAVAYLLYSMT